MNGFARRRLAVVGAVVALATVLRGASWGVGGLRTLGERVASERQLLAALQAELERVPGLGHEAGGLRDSLATLRSGLLRGSSDAAALADLSNRLPALMASHGRLVRLDAVPDSALAGPLRRLRATAVVETDFEGVAGLLSLLERLPVVLVAERIAISAPEPEAGPETPERLEVELALAGWFLPEEGS